MMRIAQNQMDKFYSYICVGLATVYAAQVFLTIGGAIKFIPSTGVTLPLISYGGSSLIASLLMLGIVLGIHGKTQNAILDDEVNSTNAINTKRLLCNYDIVKVIFGVLFAAMIVYLIYFMIFESPIYIYSEYNKLMS